MPRCIVSSTAASAWRSSSRPEHADRAVRLLEAAGERAYRIGNIVAQPAGEPAAVVL
jgi:hypothetical protein